MSELKWQIFPLLLLLVQQNGSLPGSFQHFCCFVSYHFDHHKYKHFKVLFYWDSNLEITASSHVHHLFWDATFCSFIYMATWLCCINSRNHLICFFVVVCLFCLLIMFPLVLFLFKKAIVKHAALLLITCDTLPHGSQWDSSHWVKQAAFLWDLIWTPCNFYIFQEVFL